MSSPEANTGHGHDASSQPRNEAQSPYALPPELAAYLKDLEYACITQATSIGTAMVIKIPRADIERMRGPIPIHLRQELYRHPASPVIRIVLTLYDQPDQPLALETFINIADEQQRLDIATLATQQQLPLLFYDEATAHQLSKVVALTDTEALERLLAFAQQHAASIAQENFNFDLAKSAVLRTTQL